MSQTCQIARPRTTTLCPPNSSDGYHQDARQTTCCDGCGVVTIRCSGNIRARTPLWLSKAPTRSSNCTETLDDQICITWRGGHSVDGDRNSLDRRNRSPGAGRSRRFLSGRKFRNCIHTCSATGNPCRRPGNGERNGISTIHPFISETRNVNQTLVGTGRPPPAARRRCSRIHVSAAPR
jgi:hypothetical protein